MMHRLLFLTAFVFAPSAALAQTFAIDQGSFMIGGGISFTSQGGDLYENGDEERLSTLSLSPTVQLFIRKGLAVGGTLFVSRTARGDFSRTALGIGPRVSYFFGTPTLTAYPYVSLSPSFVRISADFGDGEDLSGSGFGLNLSGGVAIMMARNVSMNAGVFYLYESASFDGFDDPFTGNTIGIEMGIAAFVF